MQSAWAKRFGKVTDIDVGDPSSWEDRVFLTLDLDWAIDPAIALCLDVIEETGVAATLFVTHDTPLLERMRRNPLIELGLHPNFGPLLDGRAEHGATARTTLALLRDLVPEARAVRSHSMTQSSRLLELFKSIGLTHDCNHFIPAHAGIELRPYSHWNGMTRVPYFWEDDVDLIYGEGPTVLDLAVGPGLKVFDFHPIHVALNTQSIDHFETTRAAHRDWTELRSAASPDGGGVLGRFVALLRGEARQ